MIPIPGGPGIEFLNGLSSPANVPLTFLSPMRTYSSPVNRLLSYAKCQSAQVEDWADYLNEFGFTQAHVPELLMLMQDTDFLELDPEDLPTDYPENLEPELAWWGPIHAWRALGQLQAPEFLAAAVSFLKVHDDINWAWEEFPDVFGLIGPSIMDDLVAVTKAEAANEMALTLMDGLRNIVEQFPETRDRYRTATLKILSQAEQNHASVNGSLITGFIKFQITDPEAIAAIEAAFQTGNVDEWYVGTWPRVQVELGLKAESDFPPEALTAEMPPGLAQLKQLVENYERQQKPSAFAAGLPIERSAMPSTKPPAFGDILKPQSATTETAKSGFGSPAPKTAKKSKKKKKR